MELAIRLGWSVRGNRRWHRGVPAVWCV